MVVAAGVQRLHVRGCVAPRLPSLAAAAALLKEAAPVGRAMVRRLAGHSREARPRINARGSLREVVGLKQHSERESQAL